MYVKGACICEIQDWLQENKAPTSGALRYQRTGQARFQKAMIAPYTWPDKTIYDMLARQEYLGHTVTAKTYKVSCKSKKGRCNPPEKRYFFPNTHEALVDMETFETAQKRLATRNRPSKVDEIDLFSGLLYCADCEYKMYLLRGPKTLKRKHAYTCGNYRNRARTGFCCSTHYIRKSVVTELILDGLRQVTSYAREHERDFVRRVSEQGGKRAAKELEQKRKELAKSVARIAELDVLFRKLYEDNALGRLSDEQFAVLTSGYEDEKKNLSEKVIALEVAIKAAAEKKSGADKFLKIVRKYTVIQELNYEIVHEFIDRIAIHELDKETNTPPAVQKTSIVITPGPCPGRVFISVVRSQETAFRIG